MDTPTPLRVNGEPREAPPGLTIRALLAHLGRDPEQPGVAIALNERVVRRALWDETAVPEGARVEIITASQGG